MSFRHFLLIALSLGLSAPLFALDPIAEKEINHLLTFIANSNGRFIRSGTEYPPKEAADHLRMKLGKAGSKVKTTEDFISGIASTSYLTGKPYQIKLPDGTVQPTGPWLTQELARFRKSTSVDSR